MACGKHASPEPTRIRRMRVLITGGGGFIGSKLAKALLARGTLSGLKITRLVLADQAFPDLPKDARLETLAGDIADPQFAARALAPDTDSIFHLAAVVSGAAEADFDLGMRVNLGGVRAVLDQARRCVRPPRLVFASSVAAFGGDLPDVLDDSTTPTISRAKVTSTAGRCACRPSSCARARRTPRRPRSRAPWCASR